ncbi:metallophosphoesterase [Nonomuraea jiangxiensis]|uniref:metallophosphoesterase n=1 Tax=Nonomuraea jiangxiensis TaxID=633440 RepID=UPI001C40B244
MSRLCGGQRAVVVGDVHGFVEELLELLERAGLRPDDLLVSVGDVVDRGPAPGEVGGRCRTSSRTSMSGSFMRRWCPGSRRRISGRTFCAARRVVSGRTGPPGSGGRGVGRAGAVGVSRGGGGGAAAGR